MHTVGSGIWWETWKKWKNEKCTLYDLDYGEKTKTRGKWEIDILGPG